MARYIVLKFDDNDAAVRFLDQINHEDDALETEHEVFPNTSIVALIPTPTLFCDSPIGQHGQKKAGWSLGKTYGWWVDRVCGKPSEAWGKNYRNVISSAKNLLEEEQ